MKKLNKAHFFISGLFLAIIPYCYLCFFANPSADDFSFSTQAQQNEFFHFLYANYLYGNGRYVSNILIYTNPLTFNSFAIYKVIPFVLICLLFSSNYYFTSRLFKGTKYKLVTSLIISLLFIHNMPIVSEGIYWYTGSVIYVLGVVVFQTYLGLLIRVFQEQKKGVWLINLTILLFFSCGFNEVLTLFIVFFLAIISYVFYKNNFQNKKTILIQFLFVVLFAAILILAPGNSIRGEVYQNTHNLTYSISYSLLQIARFSLTWIFSIPLIAASLLYFQINKTMRKNRLLFKNSFYLNRWSSLLILFSIIFICVFPPYWATGILGQHRTLNVAYFFFIPMWFVNLTVWYNYYQKKLNFGLTHKIKTGLSLFLLVGILFTGNGFNALSDIFTGKANQFNTQLNKRFKTLHKVSENKKTILFKPINPKPNCLFTSDIATDPNYWTNQAYNLYFRLDSVEIIINE